MPIWIGNITPVLARQFELSLVKAGDGAARVPGPPCIELDGQGRSAGPFQGAGGREVKEGWICVRPKVRTIVMLSVALER
jgi:hypothetical protein